MRYIVTEINMEKKSPSIVILTVIVVVTALAIPMLPGITAADNSNSISKEIQWCCSYIENDKDNSHTLSIPIIDIKSNFII